MLQLLVVRACQIHSDFAAFVRGALFACKNILRLDLRSTIFTTLHIEQYSCYTAHDLIRNPRLHTGQHILRSVN